MKNLVILAIGIIALSSCEQKPKIEVKHATSMNSTGENLKVKVVNAEDPVCHMKTDEFLKETAEYDGKTYGFCSANCKKKFEENPEKYLGHEK